MAIRSAKLGIWTFDICEYKITLCDRCRAIFSIPTDMCVSVPLFNTLIADSFFEMAINTFLQAKENGNRFEMEFPIITYHDSQPKWVGLSAIICYDGRYLPAKIHGTVLDITERKTVEVLKQDMLAMVSHDLRSPLSTVKLYVQMGKRLADSSNDEFLSGAMEKADKELIRMNKMIQSFLDVSVIESGQLTFIPEQFNMNDLLSEIIDDMKLLNHHHQLLLKPGTGVKINADRHKISQILYNLFSNAIKYSPHSNQVIVASKRVGDHLHISVKDFGIGIKKSEQAKVFNRFYRVENETTEGIGGYGIGLYVAKQIILQHGGLMWVESEENKGSTFFFSIPIDRGYAQNLPAKC